jgi:hypothetical protein
LPSLEHPSIEIGPTPLPGRRPLILSLIESFLPRGPPLDLASR